MARPSYQLDFERPVSELDARLDKLEQVGGDSAENREEIRRLRRERTTLIRKIYSQLEPWQTVRVARHPDRPMSIEYIDLVFDEFVELHGDKAFGDDRAILTGFAKLDEHKVMVVGQQKGRTLKERQASCFGCPHPEGYRKSLAKMRLAAKFQMPVVCFIDTPGAYPGIGAEERGQAQIIANSIFELSYLRTPIICIVIGEGGSGGALAIGVGDRIAMLEHAYYSVISPEGCAGILWKSAEYSNKAAEALKLTSKHLAAFGVVDDVLEEPLGAAHRDHHLMASRVKMYLSKTLRELTSRDLDELVAERYEKFRRMGFYRDASAQAIADAASEATQAATQPADAPATK